MPDRVRAARQVGRVDHVGRRADYLSLRHLLGDEADRRVGGVDADGRGRGRRDTARRRLRAGVRDERQGRDHDRAGDAAHVGLPARAVLAARLGRPRPAPRPLRAVEVQLGAGHALRVPPDVGALGARRAHRAGYRRRLPRVHPHARDRAARPARSRGRRGSPRIRATSTSSSVPARPRRPTSSKRCSASASSR